MRQHNTCKGFGYAVSSPITDRKDAAEPWGGRRLRVQNGSRPHPAGKGGCSHELGSIFHPGYRCCNHRYDDLQSAKRLGSKSAELATGIGARSARTRV
jgi:hypothetical protein